MERINKFKAIECIVKARDDNTKVSDFVGKFYLYTIMLSHIEHIKANLYNFKFIGRTLDPKSTKEIYLNMQVLVNDSSVITNSKYYINNKNRLSLVNSYEFDKKENADNSYRIDLSIDISKEEKDFFLMEIVNIASNSSSYICITLEMFFKSVIFIYNMLDNNIINGDIFLKKYNDFRLLSPTQESYNYCRDVSTKLYTAYWNKMYVVFFIDPDKEHRITYCTFSKEEFSQIYKELG